jgi:hypothetical protein
MLPGNEHFSTTPVLNDVLAYMADHKVDRIHSKLEEPLLGICRASGVAKTMREFDYWMVH